jgi:integral membrane sensor domain MASE1
VSRLWPLAWTAVAFAAATLGALTLRRLLLRAVPRWAPESQALGATATALRRPSLWWCVVVGLYVASEIADDFTLLPSRWLRVRARREGHALEPVCRHPPAG